MKPEEAAAHFRLDGQPSDVTPQPGGHIHDSWVVTAGRRYLLQRLNTVVFPEPRLLAANLTTVLAAVGGPPEVVATESGDVLWDGPDGSVWRAFHFVEGARPAAVKSPEDAARVATALGRFHRRLAAVDPSALTVVLPHFHDPAHRLVQLQDVVRADPAGRLAPVEPVLAEIGELAWLATALPPLPCRVAHHDARADNILVDDEGEVVAIVDLDTVMPGSVVWDVGDLVRSATANAREDCAEGMAADPARVRAVLDGYAAEAGDLVKSVEVDALALAGPVITWEVAVRFLADHLAGDVYFRIGRPGHNADRARAQLRLARSLVGMLG